MHATAFVLLASIAAIAQAGPRDYPEPKTTSICCEDVDWLITKWHEQGPATSFCSSYLHIGTKTTTVTSTETGDRHRYDDNDRCGHDDRRRDVYLYAIARGEARFARYALANDLRADTYQDGNEDDIVGVSRVDAAGHPSCLDLGCLLVPLVDNATAGHHDEHGDGEHYHGMCLEEAYIESD